jgi:hypothetical protein
MFGEAIHSAELPPKVLETVASLEFEGQAEWRQLVQNHGLDPIPTLALDCSDALRQCQVHVQAIDPLLRKNRVLALSRAPASKRLEVLRELAARCPGTFWDEDVKEFQTVRLDEIRREVARAAHDRDEDALKSLQSELRQESWRSPPPKQLVQQVDDALKRILHANARNELWELVQPLNDALAAFDVPRGRELREQWNRIMRQSAFQPPFDDQVAEAMRWLAEDDAKQAKDQAFEAAIADLDAVLALPTLTLAELNRLWMALVRFERPIPQRVVVQASSRRKELTRRRSRKHVAVFLAGAGIVAAAGLLIAAVFTASHRAKLMRELGATVHEHIAAREFAAASDAIERQVQQYAWSDQDPRTQQIRDKVALAAQADDERVAALDAAIEQARFARIDEIDPPAFETAERLAVTSTEKEAVNRVRTERARKLAEHESLVAKTFETRTAQLGVLLRQIEFINQNARPLKHAEELVAQGDSALRRLKDDLPAVLKVNRAMGTTIDELTLRLDELRNKRTNMRLRASLDGNVTAAVGDAAQFCERLRDRMKGVPDAERDPEFRAVIGEARLWESHIEWEQLVRDWRSNPIPATADAASERVRQCRKFLADFTGAPDASIVQAYLRVIEPIAQRGGDQGAQAKIGDFFRARFMHDLWMVKHKKDGRFFLTTDLSKDNADPPTADFLVLSETGVITTKRKLFAKDQIEENVEAPQCVLAREALDRWGRLQPGEWDDAVCQLISLVIDSRQVDPILQLVLVRNLVEQGAAGSLSFDLASQKFRDDVKIAGINTNVEWMDPAKKDKVDPVRTAARKFLAEHNLTGLAAEARFHAAKLGSELEPERVWVGWLHQNSGATWGCSFRATPAGDHSLWVIVPQSTELATSTWVPIGQCKDGQASLSTPAPGTFRNGRPVFARKNASK